MANYIPSKHIDSILEVHRSLIGADWAAYRGHCQRLFCYLSCFGLSPNEITLTEVAIAFHDLGIWTADSMDYLAPSCEAARLYISDQNLEIKIDLVEDMINSHHKMTKAKTHHLAEYLRKADLIDLSATWLRFGIPKEEIKAIKKAFPFVGFQKKIYTKVAKHALKHLWNPFPMLKI